MNAPPEAVKAPRSAPWPLLGWLIVGGGLIALGVYRDNDADWLRRDAQTGPGIILGEVWSGHTAVDYEYKVGAQTLTGRSYRSYRDPAQAKLGVGGKVTVYYSSSHPWISSLNLPEDAWSGWGTLGGLVAGIALLRLGLGWWRARPGSRSNARLPG